MFSINSMNFVTFQAKPVSCEKFATQKTKKMFEKSVDKVVKKDEVIIQNTKKTVSCNKFAEQKANRK